MAKTCRTEGPCSYEDCDCGFYEESSHPTPTYAIAHGGAAVQAARIIAGVAAGKSEKSTQTSDARPTVAPQQCGDIMDTLDAIELVAKNCMGQAGMKTIYDLVQHAKWRITPTT